MTLEENIFKHAEINEDLLLEYGFRCSNDLWNYETLFLNGDFKAVITVNDKRNISGNVYETATDDVFLPLRVESMDGFAAEVRNAYIHILQDIKKKCCRENIFVSHQANRLAETIHKKYSDKPVFPWDDFSGGVFKNPDNGKWYAIVMNIKAQKVDKRLAGEIEVVNIKLKPEKIQKLHKEKGFYPAYHMNKKNWITILLNDTVPDEIISELLEESHNFTLGKRYITNEVKE